MLNKKAILPLLIMGAFAVKGCAPQMAHHNDDASQEGVQIIMNEELGHNLQAKKMNKKAVQENYNKTYRISAQDTLVIVVSGEEDLSGEYTVSDAGEIILPLIGNVTLKNSTLQKAADLIKNKYADGYLVSPNVSVERSKFNSFYVLGEEAESASYDLATKQNILTAATKGEDSRDQSYKKMVKILRMNSEGQVRSFEKMLEADIKAGDVIIIQEKIR